MTVHNECRLPPLFILCPIRSFSSIACAMIGQHPEMYGFPELRLFNADTLEGVLHYHDNLTSRGESSLRDSLDKVIAGHVLFFKLHEQRLEPARFSDGLLRAFAELRFGGQTARGIEQAETWLQERGDWPVRDVFDVLREAIQPRRAVDKSPHTGMSTEAMKRVHRLYPQARFLHLTRHPVSTQKSMHKFLESAFRKTYPDGDPRNLVGHCARLWYGTHRGILDFTRVLPSEQTMRLRGEDLLEAPKTHLERIARWLEVRTDPQSIEAMMHPEWSPYANPGPQTAHFGNDPKFLAEPKLRPAAIPPFLETPARWNLDADLQRHIIELAHELGYAESSGRQRGETFEI